VCEEVNEGGFVLLVTVSVLLPILSLTRAVGLR